MKTKNSSSNLDREIKKSVQTVEYDVPLELETAFLEKLDDILPEKFNPHRHRLIYYGLVTAASILLVIIFFLYPIFNGQENHLEAVEIWVQAARLEDHPASTVIIKKKDPDITIFWIEKINNMEENNEKNL
jgi:hypothetical protein